jgi:CelD/BcsL family acetyltransferase involved in cellulose biosynthesis
MMAKPNLDPWSSFDDALPPVAPQVGPFPTASFLRSSEWAMGGDGDVVVVGGVDGSAAFVVERGRIRFAGPESITDYHTPLGETMEAMAEFFRAGPSVNVRLDSLPDEAVTPVVDALREAGARPIGGEHAATGVLTLPATHEAWLMSLAKKERHEVRRKRRRYEYEHGPVHVRSAGMDGLGPFIDLHRMARGPKGSFMTDRMARFFETLVADVGAVIHQLVSGQSVVASAFGFETADAYYYYNSAYDMDAAHASPGIILLSELIAGQIDRGARTFDFLKGAESYKYRLGARPRTLTVVEGRIP